jgi:hypothetical protein
MNDLADRLADRSYWGNLAPALHLDGSALSRQGTNLSADRLDKLDRDLRRVGYYAADGVLPADDLRPILEVCAKLHRFGLPLVFAFVYDETWNLFLRLAPLWARFLGEDWRIVPSLWGWFVEPGEENAGWRPHRDRDSVPTVRDDGTPLSLTAWIPLTPALPSNGCIYVVPWPHTLDDLRRENLQRIRALPAMPGSVIGWHHEVYHWSGRSTEDAPFPRVSLSIELQRADFAPLEGRVLDPSQIPAYPERIRLIGEQILRYRHMTGIHGNLEAIARKLDPTFPPDPIPLPHP